MAERVNGSVEKFGVNEKSSVKKFGDTQESSEKGSEIMQKGSEKKFGDSKNKSKNIGKTAQKIIDFVISDPSMSAETMAYKIGISSRAVEKQISKLRSMGILSREGADHGGYWRIMLNHKLNNKPMEIPFIPLSTIITVLVIAFFCLFPCCR